MWFTPQENVKCKIYISFIFYLHNIRKMCLNLLFCSLTSGLNFHVCVASKKDNKNRKIKSQQTAQQEVLLPAASAEELLMPLKSLAKINPEPCAACCFSKGRFVGLAPPPPSRCTKRWCHWRLITIPLKSLVPEFSWKRKLVFCEFANGVFVERQSSSAEKWRWNKHCNAIYF